MSLDDTSLAIGRLQAGQTATNERLDKMEITLAGQDDKLDKVLAHLVARKAERKIIAVIAAAVGSTVGMALGWFHK